jgi:DNA polymerase-4/protein ImuB
MTIGQALGLVSDLVVVEPDPAAYGQAYGYLRDALYGVSPIIEAGGEEHEGRVFIGMDGLAPLYGNPVAQLQHIERVVLRARATIGFRGRPHLGWGRGKFVAWVAAATGRPQRLVVVSEAETTGFLARQPVRVLPVLPAVIERLERLGLVTLGAVAALSESALVSQFGRQGRKAWRYASGRALRAVRAEQPDDPLVVSLDLAAPSGDREFVNRAVDRLIRRVLHHGKRRGRSIRAVRMLAYFDQGGSWSAKVVFKEPTAESTAIGRMLRQHLGANPPQGLVARLTLRCTAFGPEAIQRQVFQQDASSHARGDRLQSLSDVVEQIRLRHMKLFRIMELAPWSRIPERRHVLIDFDP